MHLWPAVTQQYWNQREGLEDWRLGVMAMAGREAGCWSEGGGHVGKGRGWGKCTRWDRDERGTWARGWTKALCPLKKKHLLMIYRDFRGIDQIIHRTPFLKDLSPAHLRSFISQVAGSLSSWVLLPQPAVIAVVLNFCRPSVSAQVSLCQGKQPPPVTSFSVSPVPLYSFFECWPQSVIFWCLFG